MTPELIAAIEQVYAAFADEKLPRTLDYSPVEDFADFIPTIRSTPLRAIPADVIGPYACSALLTAGGPDEYRYFLPRILECAIDARAWIGFEPMIIADRLARCGWRNWSAIR
jgi:hypothetical protein